LAPDSNLVVEGKGEAFQKGLEVLTRLSGGKVYLGLDARGEEPPSPVFTEAQGVEKFWVRGPHPAGNVGVHIHHIDPIGTGDKVWTMGVQEVITLGSLWTEGRFNAERVVALTGSKLDDPHYVRTFAGANIGELLKDNYNPEEELRFISGDVLSGEAKKPENFLNFYDDQVTVIAEGRYYELFGWLLPLKPRVSLSRTFPNFLFKNVKYEVDTNMHGEKRAFVVTGQYEEVLPMDIYPQHLMKAILTNDYERMEGLGILELIEEDIALAEFACTSKQPLQQILRRGLDMMWEQG
ncbi:MAG: NADH:ubiquinone reductase (Na(+)-transporting) subunit A, partial [Bacteroidetes bacterium]